MGYARTRNGYARCEACGEIFQERRNAKRDAILCAISDYLRMIAMRMPEQPKKEQEKKGGFQY